MTSITRTLLAGLLAGGLLATQMTGAALAQAAANATQLATFKAWTAWKGSDATGDVCYISAQPEKSDPSNVNRSPIHFLIIHRKGMGTKNEVQTLIGYPFNSTNSNASASIDGKSFPMVTDGEGAWLADTSGEAGFVAAMKAGSNLVVKGTSQRGTNTTDTYSLSGVTAAMNEIDKACA
ncbi:MAG TPA: invasion associated locus B family protein [Devosia sp.]|jgi:hypothetical protein